MTLDHAQRLIKKLESLDAEFRVHHYSVVDLVTAEEELVGEQDTIDQHDDIVEELSVRIQKLVSICSNLSEDPSAPRSIHSRKLEHLDKDLSAINTAIDSLDPGTDHTCRLQLHQEQIADFRRKLADIRDGLLAMNLDNSDDLMQRHVILEKVFFDCSLLIEERLKTVHYSTASSTWKDGNGVRLPKLDVPTFSGDIINWQTFWE
jgi:DNA repair exonuclease SbcCD ATPase subunit